MEKLVEKLNEGIELDPVLISGNKLVDGGHRIDAYIKAGRKEIPAIDISPVLDRSFLESLDQSYYGTLDYENGIKKFLFNKSSP